MSTINKAAPSANDPTNYLLFKDQMRAFVLNHNSNAEGIYSVFTAALTIAREGGIPTDMVLRLGEHYGELKSFAEGMAAMRGGA